MAGKEVVHRSVKTDGIEMHVAEQGCGPLVLFLHGFPELWFSWRAVVPDLRGYGDTKAPPLSYTSYTVFHIVGDLIGLFDALGEPQAFVVGHDWEPGRAEKAFAGYDTLTVIKKFLLINKSDLLVAPPGKEIIDVLEVPSNLELTAAWQGAKINVPTKFITGNEDIGFEAYGIGDYVYGGDRTKCPSFHHSKTYRHCNPLSQLLKPEFAPAL
ncbi:hypothetical protein AMTRI_Chr03g53060 [Amborella trichopoda]